MYQPKVTTVEPSSHKSTKRVQFIDRVGVWFSRATVRLGLRRIVFCPTCGHDVTIAPRYLRARVCDNCSHHFPMSARMRIDRLVDPHSFSDLALIHPAHNKYRHVRVNQRTTDLREAVVTGTARLAQHPIVIAVFDFAFRGGTMSVAVGEQITRAFEYAAQNNLPLIAIIATGGVRIQEGMPALMQMAATTQAVQEFQNARRPFIAVLTNPTTGGVYASFANLADIMLAEPGALVGFAGPRVVEALTREKLPADSHRAESAYAHGMLDAIVPREDLRETLAQILSLTAALEKHMSPSPQAANGDTMEPLDRSAWEAVMLARHADRPTALDYLPHLFADFVELHGDRVYSDDPAIVGGLGRFENESVVVIAQERGHGDEHHRGSAKPEGYRKAARLIRLAERFHLPIVTFVDTPGADPGYDSEQRGIAGAIANCLAALVKTPVPTLSIIIGEGTSGGALALAVTDRVLMLEYATFSVISPEGASAVLFGNTSHASDVAERMENRAHDLLPLGIVDLVVPEPEGGAHAQPAVAIANVKRAMQASLAQLLAQDDVERLAARRARYRRTGLDQTQHDLNSEN